MEKEAEKDKYDWLANKFGSRRGFVITHWHRLLYFLGIYNNYRQVDWGSIERLVFICKGNICRSPFAEVVARSMGIEAISCGIDTIEGAPADEQAMVKAREMGYDLEGHKTTPIMYLILRRSDLLVAMEPSQAMFLDRHLQIKHHCTLLGVWPRSVLPYIHDPYGIPTVYLENCFRFIESSVHGLAKKIENKRRY